MNSRFHRVEPRSCGVPRITRLLWIATAVILAACSSSSEAVTPTVQSVTISPSALTLTIGVSMPLVASALTASGTTLAGKTAVWATDAPTVATVSTSGQVTAVAVGSARITATVDGKSGNALVTVQERTAQAIDITPPTATIAEADTLRLIATVRDAQGNPINATTVTWTSSAPAIVTISSLGTVTAVAAGSATITAAADGKTGTATINVQTLPRIVLDQSATVTKPVTSAGGTLTTVSSGVTYRLVVPPGAIAGNVSITMTPLSVERKLPAGGSFVGGVKFDPTGTVFLKPLTLTMVSHVTPPAGQVVVGYMANDTGGVTEVTHSTRTNDSLTLTLRHFSVGGWGQFVQDNVPLIPTPLQSAGANFYLSFIEALSANPHETAEGFAGIFRAWYSDLLGTELLSVSASEQFEFVAQDFSVWDQTATDLDNQYHFQPTLASLLATPREAGVGLLPRVLLGAIRYQNDLCINSRDFSDLTPAFLMQDIAQQFGVATVANGLDAPTVVNGMCVKVFNSLASFPPTPLPNQPAQIDLQYGLKFGSDPQLTNAVFKVAMTLSGTATDGPQLLQTDAAGHLSGAVTPTGNADFTAAMKTCVHPDLGYRLDEICLTHSITRQFGRTINADVIVNSQAGLLGLVGVSRINGSLLLAGSITSTDLSELTQLNTVTGGLQLSQLSSLRSLAGLANLRNVGDLTLSRLTNVTDFTALSHVPNVGTLTLLGMPQVTSLAAFHGMNYTGLVISEMAGLTTLSDLPDAPAAMTGPITLSGNAKLFDVSILHNVVFVGGDITVTGNKLFTTLNDLGALTQVTGAVLIGGVGLTTFGPPRLVHVGGSLTINVNELDALSTFDLPNLVDVGGDLVLNEPRTAPGAPASAPLLVRFSALQRISGNVFGGGSTSNPSYRIFDLSLPSLALLSGGDMSLLAGLRNLAASGFISTAKIEISGDPDLKTIVLGGIQATNGGWIEIDGNPLLTTLQFTGAIHADGNIELDDNALLTSIQFAGGTAGGFFEFVNNATLSSVSGAFTSVANDLEIDQNPKLSTAAATAWAAPIAVGGTKEFTHDKIP